MSTNTSKDTMKAVGFYEHGSFDQLDLIDVPVPEMNPDEVLVDVKATALNHADLISVRELDQYTPEYPHWGGIDIAGVVKEVGDRVSRWEEGDRVVVNPYENCGECEYCTGEIYENLCLNPITMGEMRRGGFAEFVNVSKGQLHLIPDEWSYEEAAAVPAAGATAYRGLLRRGNLQADENLLIVGATGGVGSFAVQIANEICNVRELYAITSTEDKAEFLEDLGVDHIINYKEEDFDEVIWNQTGKRGVDVVYNNVGGETWRKSTRSLRYGGRLITSGATADPNPEIEIRRIFTRQIDILGSSAGSIDTVRRMLDYVWDGTIEPIIDVEYPLEDYLKAYQRMDNREMLGKVLLTQE